MQSFNCWRARAAGSAELTDFFATRGQCFANRKSIGLHLLEIIQ
jgi:hypothetical protein